MNKEAAFDLRDSLIALAIAKEPVRAAIAGYPKRCDPIDLLSETSIPYLRRIAENASVPSTLLEHLAMHADASVREAVADNHNTPVDTLWVLAADECVDIRYAMAENHNIPTDILIALREDENPYIASRAASTLARLEGCTVISADFRDPGFGCRVSAM